MTGAMLILGDVGETANEGVCSVMSREFLSLVSRSKHALMGMLVLFLIMSSCSGVPGDWSDMLVYHPASSFAFRNTA